MKIIKLNENKKLNESKHILAKENSDRVREMLEKVIELGDEYTLSDGRNNSDLSYDDAMYYYKKLRKISDEMRYAIMQDDNY